MLIVMSLGASERDVAAVKAKIEAEGLEARLIPSTPARWTPRCSPICPAWRTP